MYFEFIFVFLAAITKISQRKACFTNIDSITENIDTNHLSDGNNLNNNRLSLDNRIGHNIINDKNKANNSTKHADSENAVLFFNGCDKHNREKTVNPNVTFDVDNGYNTLYCDTNENNFTDFNDNAGNSKY